MCNATLLLFPKSFYACILLQTLKVAPILEQPYLLSQSSNHRIGRSLRFDKLVHFLCHLSFRRLARPPLGLQARRRRLHVCLLLLHAGWFVCSIGFVEGHSLSNPLWIWMQFEMKGRWNIVNWGSLFHTLPPNRCIWLTVSLCIGVTDFKSEARFDLRSSYARVIMDIPSQIPLKWKTLSSVH